GEHRDRAMETADGIRKRHAHLERASARVSGHRGHSRVRLEDRAPRDPHPVGPRMAESGERDAEDAGSPASERFVIDAQALHAARGGVVEPDFTGAYEAREPVAPAGGLEIDRQASLVAIHLVVDALAVPRALAGIGVGIDPGAKHRTRQLAPSP